MSRPTEGFFGKLENTLLMAKDQMCSYDHHLKIIYVRLFLDDNSHRYIENYLDDIEVWLGAHAKFSDKVVLSAHPARYLAEADDQSLIERVWPPI